MKNLSIFLLGGFDILVDEKSVQTFESDKVRALLAYLAVEQVQPQRREKLAGLLWPDLPERRARHNLSQTLYNLRKAVAGKAGENETGAQPFLLVTTKTIQLNPASDYWLDVTAFQVGLCGCAGHRKTADSACELCLNEIKQALALYQGDFLHGLTLGDCQVFEEWSLVIREGLRQKALTALIQLCGWQRQLGRLAEALESARRLANLDPLWEAGQRELITCLWLRGERAEALAQYHAFKEILREELGIEPDGRTQALAARLQASPCEELLEVAGRLGQHNLPVALTPLVGRELELERLSLLLQDDECRLATVVGPGGSGKTRLAVAAGWRLRSCFADGVYLVRMSGLPSLEALLPAIAQAVGLRLDEAKKPLEQLEAYLQQKQLLLVMDSFEWLLPGAEMVLHLLRMAPELKVLATSRARLNVKSEYLFPLAGLRFPTFADDPGMLDYGAVRLFMAEAKRVQVAYEPTSVDWAGIRRVCELVRGMPLGILLAAARLEQLSVADIAAALARSFDFLEVDWQDVPERQQSLRATFEYSWQLLDVGLQAVLARLGVFRGGFSAETAVAITEASSTQLRQLAHYTFIQPGHKDRYLIHDLMGEFVQEKLTALQETAEQVQARHAHYFLERLQGWGSDLKNGRQREALAEMDEEISNVMVAWGWAVDHEQVIPLTQVMEGLCLFFEMQCRYSEGEQACATVVELTRSKVDSDDCMKLFLGSLVWQARFLRLTGSLETASHLYQKVERYLEGQRSQGKEFYLEGAFLFLELAITASAMDLNAAHKRFQISLRLYRSLGKKWWTAVALINLGELSFYTLNIADGLESYSESQTLFRELGDSMGVANSLLGMGNILFRLGRTDEGISHIKEACIKLEQLGVSMKWAMAMASLSRMYYWKGEFVKSLEISEKLIPLWKKLGDQNGLIESYMGITIVNLSLGDYLLARRWGKEAMNQNLARGQNISSAIINTWLGIAELVNENYEQAVAFLSDAVKTGNDIGAKDILASALAFFSCVEIQKGLLERACRHLIEAITIAIEVPTPDLGARILPPIALYLVTEGQVERAIEVFSLACLQPIVAKSEYIQQIIGQPITRMAADLSPNVVEAAQERGRDLDPWKIFIELLKDLSRLSQKHLVKGLRDPSVPVQLANQRQVNST